GMDLLPEIVETGGEVSALLPEQCHASAIFLAVGLSGRGPARFFLGVVELEREDGETVDHQAGRLGIERGGGVLSAGGFEQGAVNGFDEVVAALVEQIDIALDLGDAGV